jgi:signal transduction histidine kinase
MAGNDELLTEFHDALRDAIYVIEDDELVEANGRVGEVAGLPTAALIGSEIDDLLQTFGDESAAETVLRAYRSVADGVQCSSRVEATLVDAEGDPVPVDIRFTRYEDRIVAVVRNLSEFRERQTELEALSDQLEVLHRVLRHDIRNDMNVVAGWLDELEAHVDDTEAAAVAVQNVRDAVLHTIELTEQARDLAEVVSEGGEMPVEPVDLEAVVFRQIANARQKYPEAEFELDCEVASCTVRGNEMLSSVFDNLLGNAVVHNDAETPRVQVSATNEGDEVVVTVTDNGPGIPEDRQAAIFGRGEKGVESPGTGMGLYLVDQLVSGYGGDVTVEPNDPTGSVFVVRLPLADD